MKEANVFDEWGMYIERKFSLLNLKLKSKYLMSILV
jgi:hypothetical protein